MGQCIAVKVLIFQLFTMQPPSQDAVIIVHSLNMLLKSGTILVLLKPIYLEQISMIPGRSFILSLASTMPVATSPMYFVRFNVVISFKMASFWASVKFLTFLTKAVFFFNDESSLWRSDSSGRLSTFRLLFLSSLFQDLRCVSSVRYSSRYVYNNHSQ